MTREHYRILKNISIENIVSKMTREHYVEEIRRTKKGEMFFDELTY